MFSPSCDQISTPNREAIVWSAIAQSLLDRSDQEEALVALKQAETSAISTAMKAWVRVAEAGALGLVGQTSAATAVLASSVTSDDPALKSAAAVTLGAIKAQIGDLETSFRLLKCGVDSQSLSDWPGIVDAEGRCTLGTLPDKKR